MNDKNDGINANLQKRLSRNALTNVGRALARQIDAPNRQSMRQNRANRMNDKNDGINANLQKILSPNALTNTANVGRALARQIDALSHPTGKIRVKVDPTL